ncbi:MULTISPECIES: DJ-1/PfpI family protein [Halobacterium]|uniref:DJ-1/PfpI family protein n=1 Tax=Halobacterium TaxID=2239 RepID=UPI00073F946E|nr:MULTISPECIES: DJ-1/PfpI family protein [Halobacterium]MCG1001870.1 DJ-1/PfpI family protein [Halobacterium noricense]
MDVAILLYEGFDELDAVAPYEVFRTAADFGADVDASLRTLVPSERVTASHGLRVEPDDVLLGTPDLVLVPGGGWNSVAPEGRRGGDGTAVGARDDAGARAEVQDGTLPERLATLHDGGATIATVCTGALIAAEGGLLEGRPATTHESAKDDLADYGVDVRDDRYVDDGTMLTAGGVTSGIDLALHLLERECSPGVAEQVAEEIEYENNY